MPALKKAFAYLASLPPMPVLLMDALQQLSGKQNLTALVDQISQDPSMVILILRIANSPFYGMPREIGSLREAIVLLGINRVRDMLISLCFSKMLPTQHKGFDHDQFRHHSIAVAECTRSLASCTCSSPDFAFTAGLLHDIGGLVIAILFPDEFSRLVKMSAKFGIEEEQTILGFNHTDIGGRVAQYWNLPREIQEAIEQHETYPEPATTKSLGLLVYTANLLIVNTGQPDQSAPDKHQAINGALAMLNVSIDQAARCSDSGRQFADQILSLH